LAKVRDRILGRDCGSALPITLTKHGVMAAVMIGDKKMPKMEYTTSVAASAGVSSTLSPAIATTRMLPLDAS
jgi:hypothetical protein